MGTTASSELVALGLGSNRGDSLSIMRGAVAALVQHLAEPRLSPLYRSDPLYVLDQSPYLNAVLVGHFSGSPWELLALAQSIEADFGRNRETERRRGERTLDVDILLYGDRIIDEAPDLIVPHPNIAERKFVLLPLLNLLPCQQDPRTGLPFSTFFERLGPQGIYYASLEPYNCPPGGIHGSRDNRECQTVPAQGI